MSLVIDEWLCVGVGCSGVEGECERSIESTLCRIHRNVVQLTAFEPPAANRKDSLMETNASDLMSGLTVFATAEELAAAEQVETASPTTTVFTTITFVADGDEA